MKDDQKQYEDLIETAESALSLEIIESIVRHQSIRERFERDYGAKLYSEILLVLTHERYEPEEAKLIWDKINSHLDNLTNRLDRNPGIAVAALDYLSNIHNLLSAPVLIEKDKSAFISETTTKNGLTQLYIRSVFDVVLQKELEKSFRTKENLSLLLIDIDDFKQVNDQYGHLEGDEVLRAIGGLINRNIRKMDTAARYGGEELAIIVPESTPDEVESLAERIRKKISEIKFSSFSVTVSIGICHFTLDIKTTKNLIDGADKALYEAKRSGKNHVVVFKSDQ